jgi:hypothetical protein
VTFLELTRKLASESGTIHSQAGTLPATTSGAVNRERKTAEWIRDAHVELQIARNDWKWMRGEFYVDTVASQQRYDGATDAFDETSGLAIGTRFGSWVYHSNPSYDSGITLYDTTIGRSDEGTLCFLDWDLAYTTRLRGTQNEKKPTAFTIDDGGQLVLMDTPDSGDYRARGRYMKSPVIWDLATDGNLEPEFPEAYHLLIVEIAFMLLERFDEHGPRLPLIQMRKSALFRALERSQLPQFSFGGPLA